LFLGWITRPFFPPPPNSFSPRSKQALLRQCPSDSFSPEHYPFRLSPMVAYRAFFPLPSNPFLFFFQSFSEPLSKPGQVALNRPLSFLKFHTFVPHSSPVSFNPDVRVSALFFPDDTIQSVREIFFFMFSLSYPLPPFRSDYSLPIIGPPLQRIPGTSALFHSCRCFFPFLTVSASPFGDENVVSPFCFFLPLPPGFVDSSSLRTETLAQESKRVSPPSRRLLLPLLFFVKGIRRVFLALLNSCPSGTGLSCRYLFY